MGKAPVETRTLVTRPDGSQIVSTLPEWICQRTYGQSGCQVETVRGVETMHGFRVLSPLAESLYGAIRD
jgi:hypothetical protein